MSKRCLIMFVVALLQIAAEGSEILINLTNQVWRYDQSGVNSPAFRERFFDDSMWPEGRSILAYENSVGVVALNNNVYPYTNTVLLPPPAAPLAPNHTVDFFRTRFTFSGPGNPDTWVLTLSNLVDDAYVAYLNGVEVSRYNMNPNNDMLAATAGGSQGEGTYIFRTMCIPAGTLVVGENVLAVRVHQTAGTSADVVWGTVLHASPGSAPAVLSPASAVNIPLRPGNNTNLLVTVQAAPCATFQWYKNNQAILGATTTSFAITNMNANQAGTYFLRSVNGVGTADSPDFVVTYADDVTPPTVLSASADPWDLSLVKVTFSEDVMDVMNPPFEPLTFYVENRDNPGTDYIGVSSVSYGSSSNIAILTLDGPRDPAIRYQLVIASHTIQDRFGNPLPDPAFAVVTAPTVFQDGMGGYVGTVDTEVRFSAPDSAAGAQAVALFTDAQDGSPAGPVHSLLRFENIVGNGPGQLPFGVTVNKVRLRIFTDDQGNSPTRLMRMLVWWNESSTWNTMANGIDQTNGVEAILINTVDTSDEATPRVYDDIDVTATVQAWVNGEPNYGFAFLPAGTDGWRWVSSENAAAAERPALLVDSYTISDPICLITKQPEPVTVRAGVPFSLDVISIGLGHDCQWYREGVAIPGATSPVYQVLRARLSDNGNYYAVTGDGSPPDPQFACTSATVRVTVFCDDFPVQLMSAIGNLDQRTIELQFSHTLEPVSARNLSNYLLSGGLTIAGVSQSGSRITLTNSPERQLGRNYTLTVRNLREDTDCANSLSPNPTVITLTQEVRLLSFDTVWRYQNNGLDLGTAWKHPQYDDSAWPQGPGLLGFETQTPVILALSNQNAFLGTWLSRAASSGENIITDYFRTRVNVPFETNGVTFAIRHVTDDGAVFYFNGAEAVRYNMRTGVVDFTTLAPIAPTEGVIRSLTNLTGLTNGWNSVAVEVHQQSALSADVLFGAEVIARVPRFLYGPLRIQRNGDTSVTVSWGQSLAILQEAPHLDGPWADVQGALSPMQIQIGSANRFYRLR